MTTHSDYKKKVKQCISCNNEFVTANPQIGEGDLVISHEERYEYPLKDSNGNVLRMVATRKKTVNKFYWVKKECLLTRHPYFWKGLLQIEDDIAGLLTKKHFDFLFERLHFKLK